MIGMLNQVLAPWFILGFRAKNSGRSANKGEVMDFTYGAYPLFDINNNTVRGSFSLEKGGRK